MEKDFGNEISSHMDLLRRQMYEKYNRVLPSGELIFNRFDKAEFLNCGKGSSIYDTSVVMGDVVIGSNVWVGPYTLLDGSGGRLEIGDFVSIAAGTMIYTHDSSKWYVSGGKADFEKGSVRILKNTVLGSMCMIHHSVTIGKHCIIGAHSFVNKDIPDYSIAVGTPARIIGKVVVEEEGVQFEYFEESGREKEERQ